MKKIEYNIIRREEKREADSQKEVANYKCPYHMGAKYEGLNTIKHSVYGMGCRSCQHFIGKVPGEDYIFCDGDETYEKENYTIHKYLLTEKKYKGQGDNKVYGKINQMLNEALKNML
jgi:hypothetical protein